MKMKSLHLRTLVLAWSMVITACLGGHTLRAQLPEMRPEFAPKYKGEILQDGQSIAMPKMLQRKQDSLMNLRYRERQAFYEHRNHAERDEAKVKMRRNEIMNADKEALLQSLREEHRQMQRVPQASTTRLRAARESSVGDTITWTWTVEANETKSFTLRIGGIGNYSIDWGNGDISRGADPSGEEDTVFTNTYSLAGTYTLTICSEVPITKLDCSGPYEKKGGITALDVTQNPALGWLYCNNNQLTALDVTQNPALEGLNCGYNQLTSLDLTKTPALTILVCSNNRLTALDVTKNLALRQLYCSDNQLTSLDISACANMDYLQCSNNFRVVDLDADNSFDLSSLPGMDVNRIGSVSGGHREGTRLFFDRWWATYRYATGYSGQGLFDSVEFELYTTAYRTTSDTIVMTWVADIGESKHLRVGVEGVAFDARETFWVDFGDGTRIYSGAWDTSFNKIYAESGTYKVMVGTVEGNHITKFYCRDERVTSLDVTKKPALAYLNCDDNQLTELDVTQNPALTTLLCQDNQLTELDVTQNLALERLYCYNNRLTALDVTQNLALEHLACSNNRLTKLDVTQNPALERLYCYNNRLTALDVTQNPALEYLYCGVNQLTELDVAQNPALEYLYCVDNQLTKLDVTQNPALEYLYCEVNQLTELDVTQNPKLRELICGGNQLTSLDVNKNSALMYLNCGGNQLTALDVTKDVNLTELYCYNNQLPALDVTKNRALRILYCHYNQLTDLDVTKNLDLYSLECAANQLTGLDVTKNTILWYLGCSLNKLTSLNVSKNVNLNALYCVNNQLTALDVTQNLVLADLSCGYNRLTELDVSKNAELWRLWCDNNQLTELDVTQNPLLWILSCYDNQLTGLDVTQNLELRTLYCGNNPLTELDVTQNPALEGLNCGYNQLMALDVTKNPALTDLDCLNNQLTALDVTKNLALRYLECGSNPLRELDVTQNPVLEYLYCWNNQLTELDVTQNPALTLLSCGNNQLTELDVTQNPALTWLYCNNNALQLLKLPDLKKDTLGSFVISNNKLSLSSLAGISEALQGKYVKYRIFSPQFLMDSVALDKELDLSEEMDLSDTPTEYSVWSMADSSLTDRYTETTGHFRFKEQGFYAIRLQHKDLVDNAYMDTLGYPGNYDPDSLPPVYVYHMVTVTGPEGGEDLDTIVPENGAGWIWQANAGEEKEIEFKGTGKGFRVDWGDGSTSDGKGAVGLDKQSSATKDSEQELKHRYASEGIYTVKVEPLSSQGRLTFLDVSDERVLALSFGDVSMLEELDCSANMLVSLDLGEAEKLKDVDFSDNRLTELKLPNHQSLKEVDGEDNRLRLSALYDILSKRAAKATYEFTPQGDSATLTAGQAFDLSSEMHLGGKNTTYTLRYADGRLASQADYTESNGIFRFMEADRRYTLSLANAAVTDYENGKAMQPITFVWHIAVSGVGNEGADLSTPPVVYVKDRTIYIKDATGEAEVYSILGQLLYKGMNREIPVTSPGVYIVSVGNYRAKVLVR